MKYSLLTVLVVGAFFAGAQGSFFYLDLPSSARINALGGYGVSQENQDLSLLFHNPALIDSVDKGTFSTWFNPFFADIRRMAGAYKATLPVVGAMSFGVVFMDYGTMTGADPAGQVTSEFHSREYLLQLAKSHASGPFTMGAGIKLAGSYLAGYGSTALLADVGGVYHVPEKDMTVGLVLKNFGVVISRYQTTLGRQVPLDVQIGTTFKPQFMPFRYSFTVFDVGRPLQPFYIGAESAPSLFTKVMRYVNVGGELILGEHLELQIGYNQRRRQELSLAGGAFGAGLSFGFLLKLKQLSINFSRSVYHAAGGTSFISLQGNFNHRKKIF
ncbi:MAG: type IX secretion system protein PorQ [Cyclobacteriaceae bacterium]|nr:type IX secretion system protein PorQ [Cyclobacteriaceae bacterium]